MPDNYLSMAFADGHAKLSGEGKSVRIQYTAVGHSERWSDPEEKVRAEFWAELVYRYQYAPERIGVEITFPDRTPKDSADLVVFEDDKRLSPYAVIECKRDGITDAELRQATEQAFGNGHAHKFRAKYVGVVAGQSRLLDPYFHSPQFVQIERLLTGANAKPLGALAMFSRETWEPAARMDATFRYLEISKVATDTGEAAWEKVATAEAPSRARMAVREGDIIVSLTRPHHGLSRKSRRNSTAASRQPASPCCAT